MPEAVTRRFARTTTAVPRARAFVRGLLADWDVTDRTDDVLLCVSELVTNAVLHGGRGSGQCLVKVSADDGLLHIEVHDMSRRRPRVQHPRPDESHGRGLFLVELLADAWGTEPRTPYGKVVWTDFKAEPQATPTEDGPC